MLSTYHSLVTFWILQNVISPDDREIVKCLDAICGFNFYFKLPMYTLFHISHISHTHTHTHTYKYTHTHSLSLSFSLSVSLSILQPLNKIIIYIYIYIIYVTEIHQWICQMVLKIGNANSAIVTCYQKLDILSISYLTVTWKIRKCTNFHYHLVLVIIYVLFVVEYVNQVFD